MQNDHEDSPRKSEHCTKETIQAIAESFPEAWTLVATYLNIEPQALGKLLEEGTLSADMVFPQLASALLADLETIVQKRGAH
jgi:hypothetical protein